MPSAIDIPLHRRPRVPRPKFAFWLFERGVGTRQAERRLKCSHETLRRICLPFDDPDRRVPQRDLMERIIAETAGEVLPGDFYVVSTTRAVA